MSPQPRRGINPFKYVLDILSFNTNTRIGCRCNRLYLPIAYLKPAKTIGQMQLRTAGVQVTHWLSLE
ncbi:hypothetical protein B0H13DRAFT_2331098 [Mycena leptocephala]|nr:hypothetical protein B0H13DRAFT_2331098 [Mycena leptocephala]